MDVNARLHVSSAIPGLRSRATDPIATSSGRTEINRARTREAPGLPPRNPSRASPGDRFVSTPEAAQVPRTPPEPAIPDGSVRLCAPVNAR
jgi:hypothetical protein